MNVTPLHGWHVAHGATMTDFNGWHMPLLYAGGGMTDEHLATRRHASLFDLGHMGRVRVSGPAAREFVQLVTPAALSKAPVGAVLYSFLLLDNGCPLDDITIYVMPDSYLLVVNASNREAAVAWLSERAAEMPGTVVHDETFEVSMFAIQGPASDSVARTVLGPACPRLDYYTFAETSGPAGMGPLLVSATGYTGERGYELFGAPAQVTALWEAMVAAGAPPAGLGARDTLRLEASMPLYGHELNRNTTPVAAGLGKFVDSERDDFIGAGALAAERAAGGPGRRLACLELAGRGPIARQGFAVADADGRRVGGVTSGAFSPTLQKAIAMAYVETGCAAPETALQVEIRGRLYPAKAVKRPFYKRSKHDAQSH